MLQSSSLSLAESYSLCLVSTWNLSPAVLLGDVGWRWIMERNYNIGFVQEVRVL